MSRPSPAADPVPVVAVAVDLNEAGQLLVPGTATPVNADRVPEYLAGRLRIPPTATDIHVYVHGWQTKSESAADSAKYLIGQASRLYREQPEAYAARPDEYRPWCVVVRWPSSSAPSPHGYRTIRDRAHAMSAPGSGHAAFVLGHPLGYLEDFRVANAGPRTLANHNGQSIHLIGHSFGGRFLCEAVQWAAERRRRPSVLGWSHAYDPRRPFRVDSLLVFQMAAPRDMFTQRFPALFPAPGVPTGPLGGPVVLTHSRWDRATGMWHRGAERGARGQYVSPVGAHSDYLHPESAHLIASLSALSR